MEHDLNALKCLYTKTKKNLNAVELKLIVQEQLENLELMKQVEGLLHQLQEALVAKKTAVEQISFLKAHLVSE